MLRVLLSLLAAMSMSLSAMTVRADDPPSAVGSVLNLLKSGKVPAERLEPVLEIVCSRGNEHDLAYAYSQALQDHVLPLALRVSVLERLAEAARNRKVIPAGDLSGIASLLAADEAALQASAIDLAGEWKTPAATRALADLAADPETSGVLRDAALEALVRIDTATARRTIDALTAEERPAGVRAAGIAALARFDVERAAALAVGALDDAQPDDVARLMTAFLERQNGPAALAAALSESPPPVDIAKLALRQMYSVGRSDADLSQVLEEAAGIAGDIPAPTAEELAALIAEVETQGDAARGEEVFRRADLSCLKCHAVSQAGGQIGPDLSPLGASSPVDYIIKSIYEPDAQIKEAFVTKVVLTSDGFAVQGIVADRTADTLVLKDADGKLQEVPLSDIEDEIEGKSLMPKGLVKFMTHAELVDLVRFLSELGKPGEYAIRTGQRMQRWRVLADPSAELLEGPPNETTFEDQVLLSGVWRPAYARVNGELPLDELAQSGGVSVVYVRGEFNVTAAGPIQFQVDAPPGTVLWIDSEQMNSVDAPVAQLSEGRHAATLRIDAPEFSGHSVRLELVKPNGSTAEFHVVDGR